jgi:hypothetical protein
VWGGGGIMATSDTASRAGIFKQSMGARLRFTFLKTLMDLKVKCFLTDLKFFLDSQQNFMKVCKNLDFS